jgi:hypothetical protein
MEIIIKAKYSPEYKQKAWKQIKQTCPETADAITAISKVLGKPEFIKFEVKE